MKIFIQTKKRDGQEPIFQFQFCSDTMEDAISEFSENILKKIAGGNDYQYFENEKDLNELFEDYKWQGKGYYLLPHSVAIGREFFYSKNSKFLSYREDVFTYAISEE